MLTLATGKPPRRSLGFTLIELMLVVVIISITAWFGVNLINSQSVERSVMSAANRFQHTITYLCDKAVLENRAMGIELTHTGLIMLQHQGGRWLASGDLRVNSDLHEFSHAILLDGLPVQLKDTPEEQPHVICQSDGSLSAFELRVWQPAVDGDEQEHPYVIKTGDPWTLTGGWHES
jgi:general secretion pathway protein H